MHVTGTRCTEWQSIRDMAARTQRKEPKPITETFLKKALISQHSILRVMWFDIRVKDVPYYVHVHFMRHCIGGTPFVSSSRLNVVDSDRRSARQDEPVDMTLFRNLQGLINIMRVRLCARVDITTQVVAKLIRQEFFASPDPFMQIVGHALKAACVWRGGLCTEAFGGCGRFPVMSTDYIWPKICPQGIW